MLKPTVSSAEIARQGLIPGPYFALTVTPLRDVKATKTKYRVQYLEHEVCERYYKDNDDYIRKINLIGDLTGTSSEVTLVYLFHNRGV